EGRGRRETDLHPQTMQVRSAGHEADDMSPLSALNLQLQVDVGFGRQLPALVSAARNICGPQRKTTFPLSAHDRPHGIAPLAPLDVHVAESDPRASLHRAVAKLITQGEDVRADPLQTLIDVDIGHSASGWCVS